jgi:peptidoglycan/LPS O-acetylase OafA/YrhL
LNNFDLIRLIAATQVVVSHMVALLDLGSPWVEIARAVAVIPGVPVFFFVSGFLILQSWDNSRDNRVRNFVTNRVLRLYPALWVCFAASVASVVVSGYFLTTRVPVSTFVIWVGCQLSVVQFFNPQFMRGYGAGVLNGSLWTIVVELQFYALTPLLGWFLAKRKWLSLPFLAVLAIVNFTASEFGAPSTLALKLLSVSFVPWIFMFAFGAYLWRNDELRIRVLKTPVLVLISVFAVLYYFSVQFESGEGNLINPLLFMALGCLVLKAAYIRPDFSSRLLKSNDISYGVYIYHMPVINFVLYAGGGMLLAAPTVLLVTALLATLSWRFVERPALRLKKYALRTV